jgi:hypothetical protein
MTRACRVWALFVLSTSACWSVNQAGQRLRIRASQLAPGTVPVELWRADGRDLVIERTTEAELQTMFETPLEDSRRGVFLPSRPVCTVPCSLLLPAEGLVEDAPWYLRLPSGARIPLRAPPPSPNGVFSVRVEDDESSATLVSVNVRAPTTPAGPAPEGSSR